MAEKQAVPEHLDGKPNAAAEATRKRQRQELELQRERILDERTSSPLRRAALEAALTEMADEVNAQARCTVRVECIRKGRPAMMDGKFQAAIEAASASLASGKSLRMPSGAGHDAQVLATIMPAGMLFVPSIGGISHHWTENTSDEDIVTGVQVFVEACRRLLTQ